MLLYQQQQQQGHNGGFNIFNIGTNPMYVLFDLNPANTKHLHNICTMLDQRRRRWANVVQILYRYFVITGECALIVPM